MLGGYRSRAARTRRGDAVGSGDGVEKEGRREGRRRVVSAVDGRLSAVARWLPEMKYISNPVKCDTKFPAVE